MAWKAGQSGNPNGREKGSKNGATASRERMRKSLQRMSAPLLKKAKEMALAGDATVMNALLDRIMPKLKPVAPEIAAPVRQGASPEANAADVLRAVSAGELSLDDAQQILTVLEQADSVASMRDMRAAIADLFRALGKEPPDGFAPQGATGQRLQ